MSDTFCIMPFVHQNLKHEGRVCACWRGQTTLGNSTTSSLTEIFNNDETKKLRQELLSGIKSEGCRSCWDLESSGVMSTRQETLQSWKIENDQIVFNESKDDVVPKQLETYVRSTINDDFSYSIEQLKSVEIRFDNTCNLMCRHCSPVYSSLWSKAAARSPEMAELVKDSNKPSVKLNTDIIDEIEILAPHLQEILITGGEPLYHEKHYKFLEGLEDYAENIVLNYNSNLSTLEHKGNNVLPLWKKFKNVGVLVSIDATPDIYPYIRVNGNIDKVEENIKQINKTLDNVFLQATCTTSVLNMTRIVDVFKYFMQLNVRVHASLVQYPSSLNPRILPKALKEQITQEYNEFIENLETIALQYTQRHSLIDYYQRRIPVIGKKLINYMNAEDLYDKDWDSFIRNMQVQDAYNNTNVLDYYPEFKEYWNA